MLHRMLSLLVILACIVGLARTAQAQPKPAGELVFAMHVTIAPARFDPADTPAQITPALIPWSATIARSVM